MFADYRTDHELHRPAAGVSRILRAAGCDITNEHDLQMGAMAYNTALLVCRCAARNKAVQPEMKSRAGRNEPCPCGSGKKYKKCCLDADRAPFADDDRSALMNLEPEILPRLWNQDAVSEDCGVLSRIMERDQAFAGVGFSAEKVAAFMDAVCGKDGSLFGDSGQDDEEAGDRAIDDLAVRYIRESGEGTVTWGLKDRFLAAAKRARSKDEARALATGIYLALIADSTQDPADDLLGIILFRKALFRAVMPIRAVDKVLGQLDIDKDEIRRLIETNDPSIKDKIESAVNELSAAEMDALRAIIDKRRENLWDTIVAGEFPVPMPCATQIALLGQLVSAGSNETRSLDDLSAIPGAFADKLNEDDYVLYGQALDQWLKSSEGQPERIVDAVRMMRELCAIRSIEDLAPRLLMSCIRANRFDPFDEEERNLIDGHRDVTRNREFIVEYSSWLRTKGYAGMADRLLLSWENCDTLPGEAPLREASAG
jgi:SEC-C motif-containing protein